MLTGHGLPWLVAAAAEDRLEQLAAQSA